MTEEEEEGEFLRQSHDFEFAYGIAERWLVSATLGADEPLDQNFDVSGVALELQYGRIGKQYGTKPGFYMIVGPNWKGEVPKGITAAIRSSTDLVFVVPRLQGSNTGRHRGRSTGHRSDRDVSAKPV